MARAHVISVVNMKGGVGKTTLSVALAESLAVMAKKKVLVMDLDAQASCTFALAGEDGFSDILTHDRHTYRLFRSFYGELDEAPTPSEIEETKEGREIARSFLMWGSKKKSGNETKLKNARELIQKDASFVENAKRLDLIGAIPELQLLERDILYRLGRMTQNQASAESMIADHLKAKLDELAPLYDVILIDCPPGISVFTEAAVRASRIVLAPVVPEYLSFMGLQAFALRVVRRLAREGLFRGRAFALLNRVQATAGHDLWRDEIAEFADAVGDDLHLFPKEVEQAPDLARAVEIPEDGKRLAIRDKYGSAIPTLDDLVNRVLDVTEGVHA
jgi:chromosome partitioning protein